MKKKRKSRGPRVFALAAYDMRRAPKKQDSLKDGVELGRCDVGVFSTVRRAEKAVKRMVGERTKAIAEGWEDDPWFGFVLVEHRLDDPFQGDGKSVWPVEFRSVRTYLGDGTLNYFSDTDGACEKKFRGTSIPNRFGKGKFAWILRGDGRAVPTLVEAEPYTKAEWKARFKRGCSGDFTDDSGIDFPLPSGGHEHTFAPFLFPLSALPRIRIPKADKAEMRRSRDEWRKTGI